MDTSPPTPPPAEGDSFIPPAMRSLASPEILAILFGPEQPEKLQKLTDIVGRYSKPKTAAELDRLLDEERNAW